MKTTNIKLLNIIAAACAISFASCSDDDMSKSVADYDPQYKGSLAVGEADYNFDAAAHAANVAFTSDMAWTAVLVDSNGEECTWASVTPTSGELPASVDQVEGVAKTPVDYSLTVTINANEDIYNSRALTLRIITAKGNDKSISMAQEYKVLWKEASEVEDYDKYIFPGVWNPHFENGAEYMLRHDAYYSWHRMKQSEHFFVFWSPEFGDNPNGEDVAPAMRVDIDDLLAKAEHFFDTNVKTLNMATLGEGKSMLDDFKMQIYLIYQDEWLATGGGYEDQIGALWVNPSTCQPVGSTIAHEIGHSFQYQTYADKIRKQGAANDFRHGFRYGFGPDGAGGCAFWEQGAQWQAQRDYPEEQFGYHVENWLNNYHRHFNHEWMRYANYWMPSYWVQKHGQSAYGRIWMESEYPEDPLQTYMRLFCGNDLDKLYADLYDFAAHMVYFDIDGVREYAPWWFLGEYQTDIYKVAEKTYQVGYSSAPGTTGFNVIKLETPAAGSNVSVTVSAVAPGSKLPKGDAGMQIDVDGNVVANVKTYNDNRHYQGVANPGFRFGYVAIVDEKPQYSEMTAGANGTASFTVPAGIEELYFVICATPDAYHRQWWNDDEADDEQWPYTIAVAGTDVVSFNETFDIDKTLDPTNTTYVISKDLDAATATYGMGEINLAVYEICQAFVLDQDQLAEAIQDCGAQPAEGLVVIANRETDGSLNFDNSANGGHWLDFDGNHGSWGDNALSYYEWTAGSSKISWGVFPGHPEVGETYEIRPTLIYTKDGKEYRADVTIKLNF